MADEGWGGPPEGPEGIPRSPDPTPPPDPPSHDPAPAPAPAARARPVQLREMRVGEVLDAAITLYRAEWKTFMGIVAFIVIPFAFLEQYVASEMVAGVTTDPFTGQTSVDDGALGGTFLLVFVQFLLIQPFLTAAVARAASEVYLGRSPSIGAIYSFTLGRIGSIVAVTFLIGLAVLLGFIALIIPGIILYVRLLFGPAAVVIEDHRGTAALSRSWALSRGHAGKIFGAVVLAWILATIVTIVITIPTSIIANASGGWFVAGIGDSIASVVTQPFMTIVAVLLYFDMRIRKEGFDLALMAEELSRGDGDP